MLQLNNNLPVLSWSVHMVHERCFVCVEIECLEQIRSNKIQHPCLLVPDPTHHEAILQACKLNSFMSYYWGMEMLFTFIKK